MKQQEIAKKVLGDDGPKLWQKALSAMENIVMQEGTDSLKGMVKRGEIDIPTAAAVAQLPGDEERELVSQGRNAMRARVAEMLSDSA